MLFFILRNDIQTYIKFVIYFIFTHGYLTRKKYTKQSEKRDIFF